MQWTVINIQTYNWSRNKEQVSVECSAINWTSIVYTLQVQGSLWKRGLKEKNEPEVEEVQNEKASYGYDRTDTHINSKKLPLPAQNLQKGQANQNSSMEGKWNGQLITSRGRRVRYFLWVWTLVDWPWYSGWLHAQNKKTELNRLFLKVTGHDFGGEEMLRRVLEDFGGRNGRWIWSKYGAVNSQKLIKSTLKLFQVMLR